MGSKSSSAPAPDPHLTAAQVRSVDAQTRLADLSYDKIVELSPLIGGQMQRSIDASYLAENRGNIIFDQSQADRAHTLGRRDDLTKIQDNIYGDYKAYDNGAMRERLLGEATTDINSSFANANAMQSRDLARRGVNPSSGAALMMRNQSTLNQALALSKASRDVSEAARLEGYRLGDRALGAFTGNQQLAMQASSAGMNMANGSYGLATSGMGAVGSGLNAYNTGYGAAAGMYGNMGSTATSAFNAQATYKNQQDQLAAQQGDWFGTALGMGANFAMNKWAFGAK